MEKRYVIKDYDSQLYYAGDVYGFSENPSFADYYSSEEDALLIIEYTLKSGRFQIEPVYILL